MYFHNVPFEVNEEDLLPLFERAGPVKALCLFKLQAAMWKNADHAEFTERNIGA